MIRVTDNHAARLARMRPQPLIEVMGKSLEASADAIIANAQQNILDNERIGPRGGHVPSLPGEAPANDTGHLHDSAFIAPLETQTGEIKARGGFDIPYAWILEMGSKKMKPRPFLVPATEERRPATIDGLVDALRKTIGLR